ncbi:beta-xylanase [Actinoplanes philippinensis]|uniref:Beta-xylanase n=1 Tax=Actinoplanes philippinensis TaxID=35752 RepID=A0A1I2GWE0_9ACTN|nr:endo-1,4-beta-xylanase [Actinoplanes philippinensis]GIE78111.1 beta-xylanase [Actinoplanes philippinensis]SFF21107.1 endo-1,4-beta-xylanase [Actinoplanes philippinensis]
MLEPLHRARASAWAKGWTVLAVLLPLASVVLLLAGTAAAPDPRPQPSPAPSCEPSGPVPGPYCPVPEPGSLRALAAERDLFIGSAASAQALAQDPKYASVLAREFSMVTPEDAMKWPRIEPQAGQHDWSDADRVVEVARANGQTVYGHALLWYASTPAWLADGSLSDAQIREAVHRHIAEEAGRYRGRIWGWDVVNEPLEADGRLRRTAWSKAMGPDWIADAFRAARAADPHAKLFLNEFGVDGDGAKSDAFYELVRGLVKKGVPIDGVGFQSHVDLTPVPEHRVENLRRFAALGLDVAITEVDVRLILPPTAAKLKKQAEVYRRTLQDCLAVPECVSFTVWGFTDRYSWIPNLQSGAGMACLFDAELVPKPAYAAVAGALSRAP